MAQSDLVLYLVLTPEFGGTRFGPFEGLEARLGANRERCHITLPESLGVAQEHCKVIRQGGANMILAPSERTAAVFLWKGDARRPVQVQTPTAVKPGDSFSLVTQDGPRFTIELGELPPEILKARNPANRRGPRGMTAGRFASAGRDLFLARLYAFSPISVAMRGWYYVTSGAIFQPRIILLGALMLFPYLTTGASSCAAFKFRSDMFKATKQAEDCNESLAYANDMGTDVENYTFDKLAGKITGVRSVGLALSKDTAFASLVKQQAKIILDGGDLYSWIYDKSDRTDAFIAWRKRIEKADGFDPDTKKLLPFLAATRSRIGGQWDMVLDSSDTPVCGRGVLRLTYRQGRNLGLSTVALDAFVSGNDADIASNEVRRDVLLKKTAEAAMDPVDATSTALLTSEAEVVVNYEKTCVHAVGGDDREDLSKLVSTLEDQVGKSSKGVAPPDTALSSVGRLGKIFTADIPGQRFGDSKSPHVDFSLLAPAAALADTPHKQWVLDHMAEVIARAIVLPCEAALKGDKTKMANTFGDGLPNPVPCLVLDYKLSHEGGG